MSIAKLEEDLQVLSTHESFARFIETVYSLREEAIASMFESDKDQVQQISGTILAYDQLLKMTNWSSLQTKHIGRLHNDL